MLLRPPTVPSPTILAGALLLYVRCWRFTRSPTGATACPPMSLSPLPSTPMPLQLPSTERSTPCVSPAGEWVWECSPCGEVVLSRAPSCSHPANPLASATGQHLLGSCNTGPATPLLQLMCPRPAARACWHHSSGPMTRSPCWPRWAGAACSADGSSSGSGIACTCGGRPTAKPCTSHAPRTPSLLMPLGCVYVATRCAVAPLPYRAPKPSGSMC